MLRPNSVRSTVDFFATADRVAPSTGNNAPSCNPYLIYAMAVSFQSEFVAVTVVVSCLASRVVGCCLQCCLSAASCCLWGCS